MAELNYSAGALDTLSSFHRAKFVVYVEGEDDKLFWDEAFKLSGLNSYYLKVAGCKNEIKKYEKAIFSDGANIVVAQDCDYDDLLNQKHDNTRILYTYGYSIENSLYSAESIAKAISIWSRDPLTQTHKVERWLEGFVASFERLLVYDLANEKHHRGVEILGDNCSRFLTSNKSVDACPIKIEEHIKKIEANFSDDELLDAREIIKRTDKPLSFIIRGHFMTNAIVNFAKKHPRVKGVSLDMLYGQMIAHFPLCCEANGDVQYLKEQIQCLEKLY